MDENVQSNDPEEFDGEIEQQLIDFLKALKGGKKLTLRDVLMYQRILNYNAVVTYKNMLIVVSKIHEIADTINATLENQRKLMEQVQGFLTANQLIQDIEDSKPKDPNSPV